MKTCTKCHKEKPCTDFFRDAQKSSGLRPDCKKCVVKRCGDYARRNKESVHRRNLKYRYGISKESYIRLLKKQKGLCAICKLNISKIRLAVDHSHETKQVRGLLCLKCNMGLGCFGDDRSKIKSALKYLKNNG